MAYILLSIFAPANTICQFNLGNDKTDTEMR